jgi:hypothetical protein
MTTNPGRIKMEIADSVNNNEKETYCQTKNGQEEAMPNHGMA